MEQEESHESRDQADHATQLPLPFQQRFLLDENTASKQLRESLLERGSYVLTLDDFDLLRTAASDKTVSGIGTKQHAWIVTRDTRFILDALKEEGTPYNIVLVSSESTTSSINVDDLSKTLTGECSPVSAYSATDRIEIVDLRTSQSPMHTLPIPPDRIRELFTVLDKRGKIDSRKLADQWGCSIARARRVASRLSRDGWLRITKSGRRNRYYPGSSYLQLRDMLFKSTDD